MSCVSLLLVNIQCLRNKISEFAVFIETLGLPDILLLTEHWLKFDEPCFIPNYSVVASYSRRRMGHGGTMILIKTSFLESYSIAKVDKYDTLLLEGKFEFSVIYNKDCNTYLICVYRPPNNNVGEFLESLEMLLAAFPVDANTILGGD